MARILLVDDEPGVLLTYRAILERKGHEVTAVATPQEARAALERAAYHLLLCDLSLKSGQDGFHTIEEARTLQPSIATILLTGLATDEVTAQARARQILVLFKPVDPQHLLDTIAAALAERRSASPPP